MPKPVITGSPKYDHVKVKMEADRLEKELNFNLIDNYEKKISASDTIDYMYCKRRSISFDVWYELMVRLAGVTLIKY